MFFKTLFRTSRSSIILITFVIIVSVIISFVLRRAGDIIQNEIQAEIAPTVGGDIVIESSAPLADDTELEISSIVTNQQGILSKKVEMNYTLSTEQGPLLVSLRGVDDAFPLYGAFEGVESISGSPFSETNQIQISKVLYDTLGVSQNAVSLSLESQFYPIDTTFVTAPGTTLSIFDGGRQVVIPLSLASKLNLLVQGSRVSYQTLIKFENMSDEGIDTVQDQLESIVGEDIRVRTLSSSEGIFQSVEESLLGYLSLINLIFLLLEISVLIFLGSRIIHENQSSLQIMRIYGLRDEDIWGKGLIWIGLSIFIGVAAGSALTYSLTAYLFSLGLIGSSSWSIASFLPVLSGVSLLTMGVSFLPFFLATRQGPLSLLDQSPLPLSRIIGWRVVLLGAMLILVSYLFLVGDIATVLLHLGLVLLLGMMIGGAIWLLHMMLYRSASKAGWRENRFLQWDVLRFLTKPGTQSSMITGGCTVLMVLLSWTIMTYMGLQTRLQGLTAGGESIFVTNVFDQDLEQINDLSFPVNDVFNVILGRIISINGSPLNEYFNTQGMGENERRGFGREFNMTSNTLADVPIITGSPLKKAGDLSVDEDFAESLGVKLGDNIIISIAGREFALTVINLRSSIRNGVQPFFYFQIVEAQFENAPKTSFFQVTSESKRKTQIKSEITSLMGNNVSFLDTGEIVEQVKGYLNRVGLLLSVLFGLMLVYALGAIFSLFRYASIFQQQRFDVYILLGASAPTISSLRSGYINIYLMISGVISVIGLIVFFYIFAESQIIDVDYVVLARGVLTILIVASIVWLQARFR